MKKIDYVKLKSESFFDFTEICNEIISKGVDCVEVKDFYLESFEKYFSEKDLILIEEDLKIFYSKEFHIKPSDCDLKEFSFVCYMLINDNKAYPIFTCLIDEMVDKVSNLLGIMFEIYEINNHLNKINLNELKKSI